MNEHKQEHIPTEKLPLLSFISTFDTANISSLSDVFREMYDSNIIHVQKSHSHTLFQIISQFFATASPYPNPSDLHC